MEFFKKIWGKVDARLSEKANEDCGCQSGCCDDEPVKAAKSSAKKKATKKKKK